MNRTDIRLLQHVSGYPCLTITLPTHRTSPDNKQDPLRLRNLVDAAKTRLLGEFDKRALEPLFTRLDHLVGTLQFSYLLDGLALFVSNDTSRAFLLTHAVPERVVVDDTFLTRDLVYELNHAARYRVLVLSEQPTRLYDGLNDALEEVTGGGFPMTHTLPGGETALPGGLGVRKSAYRDERHRQFFRQVDAALKPFMAEEPAPLVVAGVDRFLAFWDELSTHRQHVIATLKGSHDKTPAHELAKLVWPLVQQHQAEKRAAALERIGAADGQGRLIRMFSDIWQAAHDGRGAELVVESGFHYPAHIDAQNRLLGPALDTEDPAALDDAVDAVIEAVLVRGGEVVFLPDGALAEHGRIALIARY